MSERRSVLAEISWFQVIVGVLAAVTAAWIASRLGVAGTLIGTAVASFVASISAALYGRTLDKGKTLLVQTAAGTLIESTVKTGEISTAMDQAAEADGSPVERAELIKTPRARLRWKAIIVSTVVVMLMALTAISAWELVSGKTLSGTSGTTIGDTFGRSSDNPSKEPKDEPTPTPTPENTPAPDPTVAPTQRPATPEPTPTETAPPPADQTPEPVEPEATPTEGTRVE